MTACRGQIDVSICIVSWNTRKLLGACLESLQASLHRCSLEVVVVDNASTDNSADMVAERFPMVRLERSPCNLGFARGSNLAMQMARGRYLMLLNPDTRVQPEAVANLVRFMDREPTVGAAGPRLVDDSGHLQLSCGRTPGLAVDTVSKLLLHKVFPVFKLGRWDHAEIREVGWVTGACIIARREAVRAAGSLDSGIFMFYEDVEWCMRIRLAGWRVVYFPYTEVVHLGGQSVRQDFRRMLVVSQRSLFYLYQKHYGSYRLHLLRLLTLWEMLLRTCIWLALKFLRPSLRPEARDRLQAYREILVRTVGDRCYWAPFGPVQVHEHT